MTEPNEFDEFRRRVVRGERRRRILPPWPAGALNGDASSLDRFLELAKIFNNGAAVESVGDEALAAEDQAILDAYAERFDPDHQAQLRPGVAEDSGANRDG